MASLTKQEILQNRPHRDAAALRGASEHLWYELAMLRFCGNKLIDTPQLEGLSYAVYMESFLSHARNLNEFFFALDIAISLGNRPTRPGDVIVEDFVDDDVWSKPAASKLSDSDAVLMNERLAHLTYSRVPGRQYPPQFYQRIMTSLLGLADLFLEAAAKANLDVHLLAAYPWNS